MGFFSKRFKLRPPTRTHLMVRADGVSIDSPEPVGAMVRNEGPTYDVSREYDAFGGEQKTIWQADGSRASRGPRVKAESVAPHASTVRDLMDPAWGRVRTTGVALGEMRDRLLPFAPRKAYETPRYVITWVALLLGDIAGIFGAALSYGEVPFNAFGQAVASSFAAVTAGLVGADVKTVHVAKAIQSSAPDDEESGRFGLLGVAATDPATYGLVLRMAAAVSAALVVGIFALRMTIEGLTGGLVFAGLSFAIAGASFINAWVHANPAADLLDAYKAAHATAKAEYQALGAHPILATEAGSTAEAGLIEAEHEIRGRASEQHVEALKWGILRRHPQIFGHGTTSVPDPMNIPSKVVPLNSRRPEDQTLAGSNGSRGPQR